MLQVNGSWIPLLSRVGDMPLMDYFISKGLPDRIMRILNRCRLYLRVLTLSDITSADGTYILPSAKRGEEAPYRKSDLIWPMQGKPAQSDWNIWAQELSSLEEKGSLWKPLGAWLSRTHQQWESFTNTGKTALFLCVGDHYSKLPPVESRSRYPTRSNTTPRFDLSAPGVTVQTLPINAVLVTLQRLGIGNATTIVKLNSSLTPLPSGPIPFPILTSGGQSRPDPSSVPPQWQDIITAAETRILTISCDGSYDPGVLSQSAVPTGDSRWAK